MVIDMIPVILNGDRIFYWQVRDMLPLIGDEIKYGSFDYKVMRRVWDGQDLLIYVSLI